MDLIFLVSTKRDYSGFIRPQYIDRVNAGLIIFLIITKWACSACIKQQGFELFQSYINPHVQFWNPSHSPYARCIDARNPVESRGPGWVLNVQDPIVFIAISTAKWALKAFHTNTFSTVI